MNTVSLSAEKLVLLSVWRSWPPFIHSLVTMEPEATQRRLVELRSSIRMAAGPWMTAPAIDAGGTIQHKSFNKTNALWKTKTGKCEATFTELDWNRKRTYLTLITRKVKAAVLQLGQHTCSKYVCFFPRSDTSQTTNTHTNTHKPVNKTKKNYKLELKFDKFSCSGQFYLYSTFFNQNCV